MEIHELVSDVDVLYVLSVTGLAPWLRAVGADGEWAPHSPLSPAVN